MISSNDLKPGLTILVDGEIYTVLEASQNKTARMKASEVAISVVNSE